MRHWSVLEAWWQTLNKCVISVCFA